MARDWVAEFNALPLHVRRIGSAMEARLRIQHLTFEKDRSLARHKRTVAECNAHIKNCEDALRRLELEVDGESAAGIGED